MKRIICSLIALLMVLAVIPVSSLALYGYTDIRNEAQLRDIAKDLGGKYRLIRNIELSEKWIPVGTADKPFTGELDGNGYTISGLYVENKNDDNVGLFGCLKGTAVNLNVNGFVLGRNNVGSIAGAVIGGKVESCSFAGAVSGKTNVGGIVGYAYASNDGISVNKCRNVASVYGIENVGGIVGFAQVQSGRKLNMQYCANIGVISAGTGIAGGVIGCADLFDGVVSIEYTYNSAAVSSNGSNAGGIIGTAVVGKPVCALNISYCYNSEDITARAAAGAAVGSMVTGDDGTATATSVSINEFYNIGKIDGKRDALITTSVRDLANKITLSRVYNADYVKDTITAYEYEGYITSKSSLSANYANITSLNFNRYAWTSAGNTNYPYLQIIGNNAVVRLTEQPVIEGDLKVGSTLTVNTPYNKYYLDYTWYRNGVVIKGAVASKYELTSADSGCMISVRISASANTSLVGSSLSKSVLVAEAAPKPLPPVAAVVTDTTVSLAETKGCEYSMDGVNWQSSTDFTGLTAGVTYKFYQRVKATSDISESLASEPNVVVTGKKNLNGSNFTNVFDVAVNNKYYESYCFCDSKLYLITNLAINDYEIEWYADGEPIPNSGSVILTVSDELVDKKVVAVIKGVGNWTGISITGPIVPEHYSTYVYDVIAPTCTEWGYTINYCRRCGSTFFNKYVKPTGHTFGEWTDVKPATCTEDGVQSRVCTGCGVYETRETYAHGHSFVFEMKKSTCGEEGYTRERCVICDFCVYYDRFTSNGNHKYETKTVAPTCTEEGYVLHTCVTCGNSYKTNVVSATGHIWGSWTVVKAATTTEKGLEKRVCTVCKAEETREIPVVITPETPDVPLGDDIEIKNVNGKDYLFGLVENTTVNFLGGNDVKIYDKNGKVKTSGIVGTGDRVVILNDDGTAFIDAVAVIKGDIDGDGKVTATDYIKIRLAVLKKLTLTDAPLYAGMINGSNGITAKDYASIRLHIIGKISLYK